MTSFSSIKSWPISERPRERLFREGASALSDAELLAVLFRSGVKGKDAIALAREISGRFGGLRGLLSAGFSDLSSVKGLGEAKIAALLAVSEISKRQLRESMNGKDILRDPDSVKAYLTAALRDKKREVFKVLLLDKGNRIIAELDLFEGTIDETMVHPREIVRAALERHATAVILVHNHPSGRTEPSQEDLKITRKITSACATVSVRVLDHMIVGDNACFSFAENGLLP